MFRLTIQLPLRTSYLYIFGPIIPGREFITFHGGTLVAHMELPHLGSVHVLNHQVLLSSRPPFLWDMNNTKWCNGFYIEFRQNFAKETFSYDEHLKS